MTPDPHAVPPAYLRSRRVGLYAPPSGLALPDVWTFGIDTPERRRLFHDDVFQHPAKMHLGLLRRIIETYTEYDDVILDPMAGSGSLMLGAYLFRHVVLRDLQPEYVELMSKSEPILRREAGLFCGRIDIEAGDARQLDGIECNHIICSPPYGFENGTSTSWERRKQRLLAVDHDARWHRKFKNWTAHKFHYAGGQQNTGNKTGRNYWADMTAIYQRCADLLPSGGRMILVIKNHYRRGNLIDIAGQTIDVVSGLGLPLIARHGRYVNNPSLWQRRRKEQGLPIVDIEDVLVFAKQVGEKMQAS